MTDQELKKLKDDLWHSADVLRAGAHLAANKYGQPILGLIFLRYADILFKQHKEEIMAEYDKYKVRCDRFYSDSTPCPGDGGRRFVKGYSGKDSGSRQYNRYG